MADPWLFTFGRGGTSGGTAYRTYAVELVKQAPDVLLAPGGTVTGALQRATRDIPIVFVETTDPVDRGLVASLSQPGAIRPASSSLISPLLANGLSS